MDRKLTLIACVDERMGMMFNRRRQSKDRLMRERLLSRLAGKRLVLSPYSARLFGAETTLAVFDDPYAAAVLGDAVFLEDTGALLDGVSEVILYRWGEHYPADTYFPFSLSDEGFYHAASEAFEGSSHERITEDIYKRKEH